MGARGLFVRVAHQGGLVSLYAHLSSYLVQAGDPVERGQLIGRVGLTGVHASNAHLHFGLFRQDDAICARASVSGRLTHGAISRAPTAVHGAFRPLRAPNIPIWRGYALARFMLITG
jgi:murein DD-endopeptidase MepM/ murein hydrolase activator NlpD